MRVQTIDEHISRVLDIWIGLIQLAAGDDDGEIVIAYDR